MIALGQPRMSPQEFSSKWASSELKERAGAQEHFINVCALVGAPTPAEADKKGEFFTFEKTVTRVGGEISGLEEGSDQPTSFCVGASVGSTRASVKT
jgi:hypothetical protein